MKKITLFMCLFSCALAMDLSAQTTILSQNFEGAPIPTLPSGWTNTHAGSGIGWTSANATGFWSGFAIIEGASTYALIDEINNVGTDDAASLISPLFSLTGTIHPYLSYGYYFLQQGNMVSAPGMAVDTFEQAYVQLSVDGGATWTTIDSMRGQSDTLYGIIYGKFHTNYVDLTAYAGAANAKLQFVYTDNGASIVGAAIDNITVYDALATDLSLTSIDQAIQPLTSFGVAGASMSFSGSVFNNGTNTITGFAINYQQGASPVVTTNITGISIPPFTAYSFTDASAYTLPALVGAYPFSIWVSAAGDTNPFNDSAGATLNTVAFWPAKGVLFEGNAATWAAFSPRQYVFMDSLNILYPGSVNTIIVHQDYIGTEPMANENYQTLDYDIHMTNNFTLDLDPISEMDRRRNLNPDSMLAYYAVQSGYFGYANIAVDSTVYTDTSDDMASVTVSITPALNMAGDYRLELVITEDSVHNGTDTLYNQANGYSYMADSTVMSCNGVDYLAAANPVLDTDIYYNYVARYTVPDIDTTPNGVAGSLPASMAAGGIYNYTFTNIPIPASWISTHLKARILLIDNSNGHILNSHASNYFPDRARHGTAGVSNLVKINTVNLYPNPAGQETILSLNLAESVQVSVLVTDVLGKNVFSFPAVKMIQGANKIVIPVSQLAAGVYNVKVMAGNEITTKRLTVIN